MISSGVVAGIGTAFPLAAAAAKGNAVPMPATTPEEIIALAHRTYAYVAQRVSEKELSALKAELALDEKWYADAKKANDAREMRNATRELKSVRRRILFKHPDLQFKRLLAVQRGLPFSQEAGTTDQYVGRWSRPGPGLVAIDNWQEAPRKTVLLKDKLPWGTVLNPDLHWDGDRVLFAFCDHTRKPEADPKACGAPPVVKLEEQRLDWLRRVDPGNPNFTSPDGQFSVMHHRYFIYEAAADGSWVRPLTGGPGDPMKTWEGRQTILLEDADPCYLPDGGFVFNSTRCQTVARCHSGRYVPAWLLYRAELPPFGETCARNIRQLSWGEANEWEPAVLNDGRLCYTRWDYINRHAVWFSSLWTTKPDGTAVGHYYGNYSKTIYTATEVKPIPDSPLVVATAAPHHLFSCGSLVLIDTRKGEDGEAPLTRLTPECPIPESEGWKGSGVWCGPMPVNETLFFASYSPDTTEYPKGHPRAHSHAWTAAWPDPRSFGIWLVDSLGGRELIYQDPEWSTFNPIPLVKRTKPPVLVSTLPPAEQAPATGLCYVENVYDARVELPKGSVKALRINRLFNQGAVRHWSWNQSGDLDIYKESLGTVPVAADGSAAFRIPAEVPIQLQALDQDGMAIYTMRSFIYAQKGEVQGCTGCHENKMASVAPAKMPARRRVYDPEPEVDLGYRGPFSYPRSIQPIFDRHCISCHGLGKASNLIGTNAIRRLIANKQIRYAKSYAETAESKPYDYFAAPSPLTKCLKAGHGGVTLSPDEWKTLILWMDFNVPEWNIGGGYSWNRAELRETDPDGERRLRAAIRAKLGDEIAAQPFEALVNRGDETKSRILWLVKPEDREAFLALVRGSLVNARWQDLDGTCGRPVEAGCECNSCWVRRGGFNRPRTP